MSRFTIQGVLLLVLVLGVVSPVHAAVPALYTNDNFSTSQQDTPVSFSRASDGSFTGVTETGKTFYQRPVVSDLHVHLQRFSIDEAYFYISNFGLIQANSDTVALSIYLAKAGWPAVT